MKKIFVLILSVFVLISGTQANDLSVTYTDSIAVADTVAASKRVDTVYSGVMDLRGYTQFNFFKKIMPYHIGTDTNWTNDTFFVKFQHSFDRSTWFTCEIDTLLDTTIGSIDEFVLKTSDSAIGNWGRMMFIHWDSLEADSPDILTNTYKYKAMLWIAPKP